MNPNNREVPHIENVDVRMNVDVETHPVGPTTQHNSEVQISKMDRILYYGFAFFLCYYFCSNLLQIRAEFYLESDLNSGIQ